MKAYFLDFHIGRLVFRIWVLDSGKTVKKHKKEETKMKIFSLKTYICRELRDEKVLIQT